MSARKSAAAPATCGDAIDVPLSEAVAVLLVYHAERIATPGAKRSTHEPKFENEARRSALSVAPTVSASPVRAGDTLHAFWFSLPAATA